MAKDKSCEKTDEVKAKDGKTEASQPISLMAEFLRGVRIVKEYWPVFGGGALTLSVIAMKLYLDEEHIPLSITSPEVVAGLPVLLIVIAFAVVSLAWSVALPMAILLSKYGEAKRCLLDDINQKVEEGRCTERGLRCRLVFRWGLGLIVIAEVTTLLLYSKGVYSFLGFGGLFLTVAALFCMFEFVFVAAWQCGRFMERVRSQLGMYVACAVLQSLIIVFFGAVVEAQSKFGLGGMSAWMAGVMLLLALFQVGVAYLFWVVRNKP